MVTKVVIIPLDCGCVTLPQVFLVYGRSQALTKSSACCIEDMKSLLHSALNDCEPWSSNNVWGNPVSKHKHN